jgi:hypothetical protein
MTSLKILAVAAALAATLAPAKALPQDNLDMNDPVYRVMTTFSLLNKLADCTNIDFEKAKQVTADIVKKAVAEQPMNVDYLWRASQKGPYMGPPHSSWCAGYFQDLLAIGSK